jgi:DNA-directed RNA polymerase subunit beta
VLDIDHINVGAYIRNTLRPTRTKAARKRCSTSTASCVPGEPPTMEAAEALFQSLFFDSERYDLSAVGRVKMNMRLDLDAEDTVRVLRKEDILAVSRRWSNCVTARARSTTSTTSATAACVRSAS